MIGLIENKKWSLRPHYLLFFQLTVYKLDVVLILIIVYQNLDSFFYRFPFFCCQLETNPNNFHQIIFLY